MKCYESLQCILRNSGTAQRPDEWRSTHNFLAVVVDYFLVSLPNYQPCWSVAIEDESIIEYLPCSDFACYFKTSPLRPAKPDFSRSSLDRVFKCLDILSPIDLDVWVYSTVLSLVHRPSAFQGLWKFLPSRALPPDPSWHQRDFVFLNLKSNRNNFSFMQSISICMSFFIR